MKNFYTTASNKAEILRAARMEFLDESILVFVANIAHIPSYETDILCESERQKMCAYLRPADRARSFAAHVLKRVILAEILNISAPKLDFAADGFGRPWLDNNINELDFNLSHSGNMVALAVSKGAAVGIDIEQDRRGHDKLFYNVRAPGEETLFSETADFLKMWTIKEAISKAIGTGVSEIFENMKVEINSGAYWNYQYKGIFSNYCLVGEDYHLAISSQDATKTVRIACTAEERAGH